MRKLKLYIFNSLFFIFVALISVAVEPPDGVLNDGDKPRIIVSTDIGGSDPDDFQSMVHLLVYADIFNIEGLISSPPYKGRKKAILEVIDAYEKDYSNLSSYSNAYPTPGKLRSVSYQGAIEVQEKAAPASNISEGAQHIIDRAKVGKEKPLYVLVWGSITDVAQAVHKAPSIKENIRVYSIGSWNTRQDPKARDYLYNNHADLWWIENNTTFRGMYMGGYQEGNYGNKTFVSAHVKGHGSLGELYCHKKRKIKMGDTPSVLYMMTGDPDDPASESWGGRFRPLGHGPNYWTDRRENRLRVGNKDGAKTVNKWRINYLDHWKKRMDRAQTSEK
jgi:hypothetical protein